MRFTDILEDGILIFDGAMGTMLQSAGLPAGVLPESFNITHPHVLEDIHRAYVRAGSDVVTANTFGANPHKLSAGGYSIEEVIGAGVAAAKRSGARFVALDIGPLGQLLEPMGALTFDEAYEIFAGQVAAGASAGADLIIIETMADLYEVKAAVLAAKENSPLPVIATMSYQAGGRTYTGCDAAGATLTLCGLGVDAVGINCSLGPEEMMPVIETILRHARVPVIVQANAGLPITVDGHTTYPVGPKAYADFARKMAGMGVGIIGGCCGTTPEFISAVKQAVAGVSRKAPSPEPCTVVTSGTRTVFFDGHVTVIGGRINPSANKDVKLALLEGDYDCIADEAIEQADAGAQILDINIDIPEPGGPAAMTKAVRSVQSMCALPLQISSIDPATLEAGCRVASGRPVIGSVTANREDAERVFLIAKKYGALVIGLAFDEDGTLPAAEARLDIARGILKQAEMHGIPAWDILIDCGAPSAGAGQKEAAETLKTIKLMKDHLPVKTVLGGLLDAEFLAAALDAGLDAAIMDPLSLDMIEVIESYRR